MTDTAAQRPVDVPCPTCGAAKSETCRGTEAGTGYLAGTTEPHSARVEAARATTTAAQHDHSGCPACFAEKHEGHDVGWRHVDGRLFSATCHDCMQVYASIRSVDV